MAEGTAKFSDGWNYIKVVMTETSADAKTNKSNVNTKLYAVVPHSNRTPAYINCNFDWVYIPGKAYAHGWVNIPSSQYDQTVLIAESNVEVSHGDDGKGSYGYTSGVNTSVAGNPSVYVGLDLTNLDRNGITISNYTLKECSQRKLSINFEFNYDPANTWYRYKKTGSSDWETDWIEWSTYGGEYNRDTKKGYFVTPQLKANTEYAIEIKTQRSYNDVVTTKSNNFFVESCVYIKKNGSWVDGEIYIKKNGAWKKGVAYIKKNGVWKEAG